MIARLNNIEETVHWHCAAIQQDPRWLAWCMEVLSKDEQVRAERYAFEALAVRYRSSRGALRHVLSGYTGVPAHILRFIRGQFGKPTLLPRHCSFNFSDSESYWAVAVHPSLDKEIGIDIEATERFHDSSVQLIPYILSAEEQARWNAHPPDCAYTALAKVWSRKESLLKAIGVGMHRSMQDISVGWSGSFVAVECPDITNQSTVWSVHDLSPLPIGFVGALTLRGQGTVRPLSLSFPWQDIANIHNQNFHK